MECTVERVTDTTNLLIIDVNDSKNANEFDGLSKSSQILTWLEVIWEVSSFMGMGRPMKRVENVRHYFMV